MIEAKFLIDRAKKIDDRVDVEKEMGKLRIKNGELKRLFYIFSPPPIQLADDILKESIPELYHPQQSPNSTTHPQFQSQFDCVEPKPSPIEHLYNLASID